VTAATSRPRGGGRAGSLLEFARDFADFAGKRLPPAMVLLVLGTFIEGVGLILLLPLLSVVSGQGSGSATIDAVTGSLLAWVPGASPFWQIALLLGLFALLMVARGVIIVARDLHLARLQVGFVESRRSEIIRLLARARWNVVSRLRHGRITHVLGEDIQATGGAAQLLLQCVILCALLVVQFALLILLSPTLAALGVALGVVGLVTLRPALNRSRELGTRYTATQLELTNSTHQFLGGLKLAMSQNLEQTYVRAFEDTLDDAARQQIAFARQRVLTQIIWSSAVAGAAGLSILIGIGIMATAPALLVAFLFILARMSGEAIRVQASLQQIFHSLPAYGKLKALTQELQAAGSGEGKPATVNRLPAAPTIEFRDVGYRHVPAATDADAPAGVGGVTFRIEAGEFLGVTGPSGAGKTTLIDLVVGLYTPQEGEIAVGGEPLSGTMLWRWRESISYISQDSFLFHDSIRNNLLWARPDAGEPELWAALETAAAAEIVRNMAQGLDTLVGERGTLLSGGERQRVALARALLRRPVLLVLDEATNAIDAEAEAEILGRIVRQEPRPTIIMVAHREESLRLCTRVVRVSGGQLQVA
jgi:ATP-binding cassette subfamily C protein